jgi:hypothetical protein
MSLRRREFISALGGVAARGARAGRVGCRGATLQTLTGNYKADQVTFRHCSNGLGNRGGE